MQKVRHSILLSSLYLFIVGCQSLSPSPVSDAAQKDYRAVYRIEKRKNTQY